MTSKSPIDTSKVTNISKKKRVIYNQLTVPSITALRKLDLSSVYKIKRNIKIFCSKTIQLLFIIWPVGFFFIFTVFANEADMKKKRKK